MASVKTAEQNAIERKAAKARQQANAKAAAKNKGTAEFSLQEARKDRVKFERKKRAIAADAARAEAAKEVASTIASTTFNKVLTQGSAIVRISDFRHSVENSDFIQWCRVCEALILLAKNAKGANLTWNDSWNRDEFLAIGVQRK